ncbi:MAG: hypothetical protein AAF420_15370, partial [Pseudomonadota bacterium]
MKTQFFSDAITAISSYLKPAGVEYPAPYASQLGTLVAGVVNPTESLPIDNVSIACGGFFEEASKWNEVGSHTPDGSYALFRANSDVIELCSDTYASRPIWYFHSDELFLASTSQRALICLLGSFSHNEDAISWGFCHLQGSP